MTLPKSQGVDLRTSKWGVGLKPSFEHGFVYSDAWVDDARLVVANLKSARDMGATIHARHRCVSARRSADGKLWDIALAAPDGATVSLQARGLVNACGPWVKHFIDEQTQVKTTKRVRLVKGSHIVVPRLHDGDHAFILQNADNRIVFVIPYEHDFSLIGTTDIAVEASDNPVCTPQEIAYLCELASHYMAKPVRPEDVVWTYSGVRPLFDDGDDNPSAVTRDYHLEVDAPDGAAPLLSVFGGKITTFRRLAESAMDKLKGRLPMLDKPSWSGGAVLPGGDFPATGYEALVSSIAAEHPWIERGLLRRLVRAYGTDVRTILKGATGEADLGLRFGADLTEREVRWLVDKEWARSADDILWRRSKLGLRIGPEDKEALERFVAQCVAAAAPAVPA